MHLPLLLAALTLPTLVVPSAISLNDKGENDLMPESEPGTNSNLERATIALELSVRLPGHALPIFDEESGSQNCIKRGERCCTDPGCPRCCGQFGCAWKRNEPYPKCHF
ncbi:uncharacterized protein DSM5745_03921 [Aspergillus mulundensis]|uniref:Uncharacterized protein n=1 Tax=Aspergillus mulundensis TaxID=1810919 RepID=A0A3D8SB93_9EURO|nr:hypothetical protein DSM5745_03921 [Aspergillus mulundensis]RDW83595.1 hypothetical protein DSM5745_03921 [Aspergillus mulundensis]